MKQYSLNLDELKEELKRLISNNRTLEEVVRELLEEKESRQKFDIEKENLIRDNKSL